MEVVLAEAGDSKFKAFFSYAQPTHPGDSLLALRTRCAKRPMEKPEAFLPPLHRSRVLQQKTAPSA